MAEEPECIGCCVRDAIDRACEDYLARAGRKGGKVTPDEFVTVLQAMAGHMGAMLGHIGDPSMIHEQFDALMLIVLRVAGFSGELSMRKVDGPEDLDKPHGDVGTKH